MRPETTTRSSVRLAANHWLAAKRATSLWGIRLSFVFLGLILANCGGDDDDGWGTEHVPPVDEWWTFDAPNFGGAGASGSGSDGGAQECDADAGCEG